MAAATYALAPGDLLRSVAASRDTLGKARMKLVDVVTQVRALTNGAPYAVIGGLAQILWARKTHTDDLDVALAAGDLSSAHERVRSGGAGAVWTLPTPPDRERETDDVIDVCHLMCDGAVVDLIAFRDEPFNAEILKTSSAVAELGGIPFIRPELLLVTHLLRPGARAAVAAVELILSRRERGGLDLDEARRWAEHLGRAARLSRAVELADAFALE
jgi:hypothetical protein